MLNRFGSSTYPDQEFVDIMNSRLPQDADIRDSVVFPKTDEDQQLFYFEIDANYQTLALEM